jgi:HSP20 family molecular chaperone IbpA
MNQSTDVTNRQSTQAQGTRESARTLRPAVNVFENAEGITLEVDMPGVSKDRLRLQADRDSLLIEGDIHFAMPEDMEALHADVRAMRYSRSFALSRELETESVDASLNDGVLRLHIPKRAEVRPRKIEVKVG